MHLIPSHQGRPSDDPIFSLHQEATRRREQGERILDATIGVLLDDDGRLAILPTAARTVHEVSPVEWATYAPIAGTAEFRRAVIHDLLESAPALHDSAVAVATPGGSGALRHAIANFLEPKQAALTTDWHWSPYRTLCDESDRTLETYAMFTADGKLAIDALDAAIARHLASQGRALIFINDPAHNPTGYSLTDAEWASVVACIGTHSARGPVTVVIDCAYLHYGPRDPRSFAAQIEPLAGKATVLFAWSASKSFTHYGLRVGALVACVSAPAERSMVESALSYSCRGTYSNCNRGGLTAITRLLSDPALSQQTSAERDALKASLLGRVDTFNRLAGARGLRYPRYDGGFFVTVFHPHAREKAAAMRAQGVYVVPQTGSDGSGVMRLALCAIPERDVATLVDALAL